jgi:hypothetical protein
MRSKPALNSRIIILILAGLMGWYTWSQTLGSEAPAALVDNFSEPLAFSPTVSIDRPPLQRDFDAQRPAFSVNRFDLTPVAEFELEARVLGRRDYRFGAEAALSPIDLALGWGPMAQDHVLEDIRIRQRNRFYYWSTREFPIPRNEIVANSSNMHLIPASDVVMRELKRARRDSVVRLRGYLVNVDRDDGWRWRTSLRRDDSGAGACEIVLVTLAEVY